MFSVVRTVCLGTALIVSLVLLGCSGAEGDGAGG